MMALLRRNWEYKLLSLVLSILLYIIASTQRNPSRTSSLTVQPEITGLPQDLAIKVVPRSEQVTLTGTSEELERVRKSGLKATINATGAKPGKSFLPVSYVLPEAVKGRVSVEAPPMLEVELEARTQKDVDVRVLFENQPPPGFEYEAPRAQPARVTVTGLASEVERVERVVALLNNTGSSGAVDREVPVVAQDDKQQVISSVALQPAKVRVSLTLRQAPATKTVVLSAELFGEPAAGVHLSSYQFVPSTVIVRGEPAVLSQLSALRIPVSVAGLAKTETRKLVLPQPPGITLTGSRSAQLTLKVSLPAPNPTPTPNVETKKEGL